LFDRFPEHDKHSSYFVIDQNSFIMHIKKKNEDFLLVAIRDLKSNAFTFCLLSNEIAQWQKPIIDSCLNY